jgi:hypothetical protein
MPANKHHDTIELHGYRFRLRRVLGFAAAEARAAWGEAAGAKGAHVLALGADKVAEIAAQIISRQQLDAFDLLGDVDRHRALAMVGIVQCLDRETLLAHLRPLVEHFVTGWVDLQVDGEWRMIEDIAWLDRRLDGDHDGEVWIDLLWRQIPHTLGPTIAASGTSDDTPLTAQTSRT